MNILFNHFNVFSVVNYGSFHFRTRCVTFLLTTHYYKLCELETTNPTIQNKHMFCIQKDNSLIFTYQLRDHMSSIRGGFKVLHDMQYPEEILKKLVPSEN